MPAIGRSTPMAADCSPSQDGMVDLVGLLQLAMQAGTFFPFVFPLHWLEDFQGFWSSGKVFQSSQFLDTRSWKQLKNII